MKTVRTTKSFISNGQAYSANRVYDVDDHVAANWKRDGLAVEAHKSSPSSGPTETTATAPEETTAYTEDDLTHIGGGWYETPDGGRHHGKGAALDALKELNG